MLGMTRRATSHDESLFLRYVRGDAELLARESDVQDADLVAEGVSVDAERGRRAAEISRRTFHRADDVLLLEFLFREIERDTVSEEFVDDFLELPIQIHDSPPEFNLKAKRRGRILANENFKR